MKLRRHTSILVLTGALVASSCGTELASDVIDTTVPDQVDVTQVDETLPDLFADDTTTTAAAPTGTPAAVALPARLSLIDPGAVQGETIVLGGQVPDEATWSGTMSQRSDTTINGLPGPATPVIGLGMTVSVEQLGDGIWRYSGGYTSVDLVDANGTDPAVVDATLQILAGMTDITFTSDVDQFGLSSDSSFDGLESLDPSLVEFVEPMIKQTDDMTVPVPTQPLGVGATWSDTISFELQGIVTTADVTYVLTEIDGDRYTLEVTQEQSQAGPGIISSSGTFTGTIEGDVTEPMPLSSVISGESEIVAVGAGGQRVTVVVAAETIVQGS